MTDRLKLLEEVYKASKHYIIAEEVHRRAMESLASGTTRENADIYGEATEHCRLAHAQLVKALAAAGKGA